MAFVKSALPEEQQNQFSQNGQTGTPPTLQTGGSSGQAGSAGQTANAPGMGTSTKFGSNASRLSDYLTANKDQIQGMANDVSGQIGSKYDSARGGVDQAAQQFGNQVTAGYTPNDPTVLSNFQSNPTQFASDPNNVKAFQGQYNNQYKGPQNFEGFEGYQGAQKGVQDASQEAGLLSTYPGLSTYLQRNIEKNATPGQNTLDSVLLQSSKPAFQTVQKAAEPFKGLGDYLKTTASSANAKVPEAQKAAEASKQAAQSAYQGVANPFVQGLNTAYTQGTQGSMDYNNKLNTIAGKISNNNYSALSPEERSMIGYNPQLTDLISRYSSIFPAQAAQNPINFSQYFKQGPQAQMPTPANIVNPDQIAEYNALQTLSGQAPTGLNFDMPTESVPLQGQVGGQPGVLPEYSSGSATNAIEQAYRPFYRTALSTPGSASSLTQSQIDYMNALTSAGNSNEGPQPTTPPPAPGTSGDLGMGFRWDSDTASWRPVIPNQPIVGGGDTRSGGTGGDTSSGGGTTRRIFR